MSPDTVRLTDNNSILISVESYDAMKPIIRVSVGHDGAHFAADWDLEKIEVQEILNDGEDIYGPTLQFKA